MYIYIYIHTYIYIYTYIYILIYIYILVYSIRCTRHLTSKIILVPPDEHRMLVGESVSVSSPEHPDKFPIDLLIWGAKVTLQPNHLKAVLVLQSNIAREPRISSLKRRNRGVWKLENACDARSEWAVVIQHHTSQILCFWVLLAKCDR